MHAPHACKQNGCMVNDSQDLLLHKNMVVSIPDEQYADVGGACSAAGLLQESMVYQLY